MAAKKLGFLLVSLALMAPSFSLAAPYGSGPYDEGAYGTGYEEQGGNRTNGGSGTIIIPQPDTPADTGSQGLTDAQIQAILGLLGSFGADGATIANVTLALNGQPHTGAGATPAYAFTRDLDIGSRGEDVRALQKYLNGHGYPVAASAEGSLGQETDYFGALTQAALAKFQAASGITPSAGYFGPLTRAYIAAH